MKRVMITGATSGIGWQLAQDYSQAGWQVIACGRDRQKLSQLESLGMQTLCFDITTPLPLKHALAEGLITQLDCLILNAGICEYVDNGQLRADTMKKTLDVNVVGPVAVLELVLPLLKCSNQAQVALISSASVYLPFVRAEAYGCSKAALRYLGQVLYSSLKPQGIVVTTVILGFIDTPLTQKNDFSMPGLATVEGASRAIMEGLALQKPQIQFPLVFCKFLSLLERLPLWLKLKLAARMSKSNNKEYV